MQRHAWRLTGNTAAADDITQEAWLAIVRGLRRLNDPITFRAWALRIVTNKAADWIRKRQRDRTLQKTLENREPNPATSDFEHRTPANEGDANAQLRKAIDALSPELRAVVGLHYGEGMSVADIAHVLDVPPGTVKSRLHSARARLKDMIERSEP